VRARENPIEADLAKVVDLLEKTLKKNIRPVERAKDIMSSPVKTISLDSTIDEANKIMLRYGHSGLPVVKDGILCGIISEGTLKKHAYTALETRRSKHI